MSKRILIEPTASLYVRSDIVRDALFPWRAICLDTGAYAADISSGAVLDTLLRQMRNNQSPVQHIVAEVEDRFETAHPVPDPEPDFEVRIVEIP